MPESFFRYPKQLRLCSRTEVSALFQSGRQLRTANLKLLYAPADVQAAEPIRHVIAVPKRNMKRAVHRNLAKRRIREAYRQYFHPVVAQQNGLRPTNLMFLYLARDTKPYALICEEMQALARKFLRQLQSPPADVV